MVGVSIFTILDVSAAYQRNYQNILLFCLRCDFWLLCHRVTIAQVVVNKGNNLCLITKNEDPCLFKVFWWLVCWGVGEGGCLFDVPTGSIFEFVLFV